MKAATIASLGRSLLGAAALALSGSATSAESFLGMAELKALISGNTVQGESAQGQGFQVYYDASGDLTFQRADGNEFSGRWSVRPDGAHCQFFSEENCGKITRNADGTYTRVVSGAAASRWLKIAPGKAF